MPAILFAVAGYIAPAAVPGRQAAVTPGDAWARFQSPLDGDSVGRHDVRFTWTRAAGARGYRLRVGRTPGGRDLFASPLVTSSSLVVPTLPAETLFASVTTEWLDGTREDHIVVSAEAHGHDPMVVHPRAGGAFDTSWPIVWNPVTGADAYRLRLGTSAGASDLADSGEVLVTRRFAPAVPAGRQIFGSIAARVGGQWRTSTFTFHAGAAATPDASVLETARHLTAEVRAMAGADNHPSRGSALEARLKDARRPTAYCDDYARVLLRLLGEAAVPWHSRLTNVCLIANRFDCHTVVELEPPDRASRVLVDPTFGLTVADPKTRRPVGAAAISEALDSGTLSGLRFQFVTPQGDAFVRGYYLDYPLLFRTVFSGGIVAGEGRSARRFYTPLGPASPNRQGMYALACGDRLSVSVTIDGTERAFKCLGVDHFTPVFAASAVKTTGTSRFVVMAPKRLLFPPRPGS